MLSGLARNPACPDDVLKRLARSPVAWELAARRNEISVAVAEELVGSGDLEVIRCLANNPATPLLMRRRLARHSDPDVRRFAARHCGEAPDVLELLAGDQEPAVRKEVAAQRQIPAKLRAWLARDPAPEVRAAAAERWTDVPPETLRALLTDLDPSVRAAALSDEHPPPPEDLRAGLLADAATCAGVLPHAELTEEQAVALSRSPDPDVRLALADHPRLPADVREALAADPELVVRVSVLLSRRVPEELRARLYAELTDPDCRRAEIMASDFFVGGAWLGRGWLQDASLEERLPYLESSYPFLRRAAAAGGGLPHDVTMRLMEDPDIPVRWIAARTSTTVPGAALEKLLREHGDMTKVPPLLVEHPNFPAAAFPRLAVAAAAETRRMALYGADLPAELVERLAADPDPRVRAAAAGHPHLPASCLPDLLTDDDPQVVEATAAAPTFPVTWMGRVADLAE